MNEIGFRIFDFDYIERLLEVKTVDLGLNVPWFMLKSHVVPVARRFYDSGTFVVEVLDEHNLGVCQSYFLRGQDVRIPLKLVKGTVKLGAEKTDDTELRVGCPAFVRKIFKIDAEVNGVAWSQQLEDFAKRFVDRFYQDRLYFLTVDKDSAALLHELHKEEGEVDLPIRLSMPSNAA